MTRDEFIEGNLPLVHKLANRFRGRGVEYEELYAAGCVGLVKAVDRFEPERGLCFSTYAVPVILGEIRRLFRDGGSVKISRSLKELSVKAARPAFRQRGAAYLGHRAGSGGHSRGSRRGALRRNPSGVAGSRRRGRRASAGAVRLR